MPGEEVVVTIVFYGSLAAVVGEILRLQDETVGVPEILCVEIALVDTSVITGLVVVLELMLSWLVGGVIFGGVSDQRS